MAKLSETKSKPPKILLYGPAGGGKTALALTLGSRAMIIDTDDGLMTGMSMRDEFKDQRPQVEVRQCKDEDAMKPMAFNVAKSYVINVVNQCAKGTFEYDALIFDSLSSFTDMALRQVIRNSNKSPFDRIEIQHWGLAFHAIDNVLVLLRSLPIVVVVIAHDQSKLVDDVEKIEIATPGKGRSAKICRYFDEVLYMRVRNAPQGKTIHSIKTKSTGAILARSRANLEDGIDANIGMVELIKKMGYRFPSKEEVKDAK